jgi:DNA repair exonuclease SbcCD ATPase subunit
MQIEKVHQLIADKNERLERDALREAESIIDAIAQQQGIITAANKKIDGLRKDLTALQVTQLDAKTLIGE